jgi:hypothetical protein
MTGRLAHTCPARSLRYWNVGEAFAEVEGHGGAANVPRSRRETPGSPKRELGRVGTAIGESKRRIAGVWLSNSGDGLVTWSGGWHRFVILKIWPRVLWLGFQDLWFGDAAESAFA